MPLSEKEQADLKALDAEGQRQEIKAQCHRIHRATHDGSLDRPAVDDALARIAVINKSHEQTDAEKKAAAEKKASDERKAAGADQRAADAMPDAGLTIAGKPFFTPPPAEPRAG